jgi:putative pyruvate formate lyase activating enzyme
MQSLERFLRQARGEELAGFARAKTVALDVALDAPTERLRAAHAEGMERWRGGTPVPPNLNEEPRNARSAFLAFLGSSFHSHGSVSLLDVKLELARRLLAPCKLCALECDVDRTAGPAGACGLGPSAGRYLDFVHAGEEPEISPTHAILLSGCSYRCSYCSDWDQVVEPLRTPATAARDLARSIEQRRAQGVASLSWIGGEPVVNLVGILEALVETRVSVPVVWNSNMHAGPGTLDLLEGVADAWVADLKHGNDACAREVAHAPRYMEVVLAAIERVSREAFTIVRHLVLPGHVACCTIPALERLRGLPVRVNLMEQFRPNANVKGTALDTRPSSQELERAREAARGLSLAPLAPALGPVALAADPVAFGSGIWIDRDGRVTVENLSPDLADLLRELG